MGADKESKNCPFDPRFPQVNQTLNCFINYCDHYRCMDLLPGDKRCEHFKDIFTQLCPNAWIQKWDEQRENNIFPGQMHITRVPPASKCDKKKK